MSLTEKKCLYCRKTLDSIKCSAEELKNQWHQNCCYKFFGTTRFPEINISKQQLEELATETVSKGFTVTGVQKKLSLHLSKEKESRLTLVGFPAGYILKPQTEEFISLPEMENVVMNLAEKSGIKTVPNALVKVHDEYAYITKRIDRISDKNGTKLLAMEDFCQLCERLTEEKYKSSYERCAKVIRQYSSKSGFDISDLFYRLVFCFVTGNSDMHLKNFSLIETESGSRKYELSPAYDLLPVNIAMPEDNEEFALTMNDKKSNLKKKDFLEFARNCGINEKVSTKLIARIISFKDKYIEIIQNSFLREEIQNRLIDLLESRMKVLCE